MTRYHSVIEDSSNQRYAVRDDAGMEHAWIGLPVKFSREGWLPKVNAKERLVRKAASRIVSTTPLEI